MAMAAAFWTMPRHGFVKVNVHGCYANVPLDNGNYNGIGVVLRDDRGNILNMLTGTERNPGLNQRRTELFAMMMGLRMAFEARKQKVILETSSWGAYSDWTRARFQPFDQLGEELQQILRRQADNNLELEVQWVPRDHNSLAIYLAEHGGETRLGLVSTTRPFGRVTEIWYRDMGLGPANIQIVNLDEDNQAMLDQEPQVIDEDDVADEEPQVIDEGDVADEEPEVIDEGGVADEPIL